MAIKVYSNPIEVGQPVNVDLGRTATPSDVFHLYDLTGKPVLKQVNTEKTETGVRLHTDGMAAGIYLLQIIQKGETAESI